MDFVLGYEVKLSGNHTLNGRPFTDICDDLQGKYPKDFKFVGWHPLCRCYAVPILEDEDHFFARSFGNGGKAPEPIQATPENFNDWVKDNTGRIEYNDARDKFPYFLDDNRKFLGTGFQNNSITRRMDGHEPPIKHTDQYIRKADPEEFRRAIAEEKRRNPKGWMVDVHDDYSHEKCFLTEDGKAGVAVTKDGDIVSLFSSVSKDHRSEKLIYMAIENGGVKCDCYGAGLQNLYARFGAKPAGKVPFNRDYAPDDWKALPDGDPRKIEPPVIAMVFPKKVKSSVKMWSEYRDISYLDIVREFDDYDEMLKFRDSFLT